MPDISPRTRLIRVTLLAFASPDDLEKAVNESLGSLPDDKRKMVNEVLLKKFSS